MMRSIPWQLEVAGVVLVGSVVLFASRVRAVDEKPAANEFAQPAIDIGCFVSDIDKSAKFYTEAIGFKEITPFSVPGDFCKDSGLTEGVALNNIRQFVLGDGPGATKFKLSHVPNHKAKSVDGEFIPSAYGLRYITIHVTDMTATLARLKKAGVTPIGKAPVLLPKTLAEGVYLTCVHDPDGNLIELVGPKK